MRSNAATVQQFLDELPGDRKVPMGRIRSVILENLPTGFSEQMQYGMIGYVVPHKLYPDGYHCNPKEPLPFISIASQKNYISLYHCGMYADESLLNWFVSKYPKHADHNLDIGKSCIRFKKIDSIPYSLIGQLVSRMTVEKWIGLYESSTNK